jgi:hypothetical protein
MPGSAAKVATRQFDRREIDGAGKGVQYFVPREK